MYLHYLCIDATQRHLALDSFRLGSELCPIVQVLPLATSASQVVVHARSGDSIWSRLAHSFHYTLPGLSIPVDGNNNGFPRNASINGDNSTFQLCCNGAALGPAT
jgi:hypothetical protein